MANAAFSGDSKQKTGPSRSAAPGSVAACVGSWLNTDDETDHERGGTTSVPTKGKLPPPKPVQRGDGADHKAAAPSVSSPVKQKKKKHGRGSAKQAAERLRAIADLMKKNAAAAKRREAVRAAEEDIKNNPPPPPKKVTMQNLPSEPKLVCRFIETAFRNIMASKATGKFEYEVAEKMLPVYPDWYTKLRCIRESNVTSVTSSSNIAELAWAVIALGLDPLTLKKNCKWRAPEVSKNEFTGAVDIKWTEQDAWTMKLDEDTLTRWILPSTFWELDMPDDAMRVMMWRIGHGILRDGKKERKPKDAALFIRTSENKVKGKDDIDRRMVALGADVFYWIMLKADLKKQYPSVEVAPLGKQDDEEKLENFLAYSVVSDFSTKFEGSGRERILLSHMPIAAMHRHSRFNPRTQAILDNNETVLENALPELEGKEARTQIQCSVCMTEQQEKALAARVERLAEEFEKQKAKWKTIRVQDRPSSFIDSNGETINREWFEVRAKKCTKETRDIWLLQAFSRWWLANLGRDFSKHVIHWTDWGAEQSEKTAEHSATSRLSVVEGRDDKARRPLLVFLGDNRWMVHYKQKFMQTTQQKTRRTLISALTLWLHIIRIDYEGDLGDGSRLPKRLVFWTQTEKEREEELKAKSTAYVFQSAFSAAGI